MIVEKLGSLVQKSSTVSTTIADTAPIPTNSSSLVTNIPISSHDVDELNSNAMVDGNTFVNPFANSSFHATNIPITSQDVNDLNPNAMIDGNTFVNPFATSSSNAAETSSSQNVDPSNMHTFYQPYPHEFQWTKDHPLEQGTLTTYFNKKPTLI
nr:hypothetical protein [Tanacetum cinerariifolium]